MICPFTSGKNAADPSPATSTEPLVPPLPRRLPAVRLRLLRRRLPRALRPQGGRGVTNSALDLDPESDFQRFGNSGWPDLGPVYSGIVTPLQGGLGDGFAGVRRGQWLHGARHQRRRPRPRLQPERRRRWPRERRRRRVQGTEFNAVRSSILNRHSVK